MEDTQLTRRGFRAVGRYLASECSERERLQIEEWINSSPESRQTFDELREIWMLSGGRSGEWNSWRSLPSLRKKLGEVAVDVDRTNQAEIFLYKIVPTKASEGSLPGRLLQIAAVMMVLIGAAYIGLYLREVAKRYSAVSQERAALHETISTKSGQRVTISFEDGTRILLNSASSLRYANVPSGRREFHLTGEAYFEVVHSNRRPLIVRTSDAVIRDVGTKFNIAAWPGDGQTQVAVTDGKVLLTPNGQLNARPTTITGGEYSVVRKGRIAVEPTYTDVGDKIAWIRGELIFHNERIRNVFRQLQWNYGIKCYATQPSIYSRTLTATFTSHQTRQDIIRIIALALRISYKASNDSVLFSTRNPL